MAGDKGGNVGRCQIVENFKCQCREAVVCAGNAEPSEQKNDISSDVKSSLPWDNVEDGSEGSVKRNVFLLWI